MYDFLNVLSRKLQVLKIYTSKTWNKNIKALFLLNSASTEDTGCQLFICIFFVSQLQLSSDNGN